MTGEEPLRQGHVPRARLPAAAVHGAGHIGARGDNRGHQSEQQSRQDREREAEAQHMTIELEIERDGGRIPHQEPYQEPLPPAGRQQAQGTAGQGEKEILGEQLANQPPSPGSHRDADADFAERAADRAINRFARLAQAISSTSPVSPIRISAYWSIPNSSTGRPMCLPWRGSQAVSAPGTLFESG